jgi:hypothetical protein
VEGRQEMEMWYKNREPLKLLEFQEEEVEWCENSI